MDLGIQYRSIGRDYFTPGQYTAPLVCSALREEHSIFGGSEQLRKCIDWVVEKYHPRYVVIANSCVAGVIGDDVDAVASQAGKDWQVPILSVPCHSFLDGDFYAGFYHSARILAERFMTPRPRQEKRITILGDRGGYNTRDIIEIKRLSSYFGFEDFSLFPANASIEEMQLVPTAAINIPVGGSPQARPWMENLAADLQSMFGTAWLKEDYPVGWTRTRDWLSAMGEQLDKKTAAQEAINAQTVELNEQLQSISLRLRGKKLIFCIGRSLLLFDPAWVFELIELSGARLCGVVLLEDSLTTAQQRALREQLPRQTIAPILGSTEASDVMRGADFIISTHELEEPLKPQLFLPMQPLVGVRGVVYLLELMVRLAERRGNRGGIIYG
jgi:nitrogenase molybdenum-iron protein alpha chain